MRHPSNPYDTQHTTRKKVNRRKVQVAAYRLQQARQKRAQEVGGFIRLTELAKARQ